MRQSFRRLGLTLFALAALLAVSCGSGGGAKLPETGATLEGTVKFGDETLQFATIIVRTDSGSMTGRIEEDGKYRVANVPLGEVKIGVNTMAAQGEYQSKSRSAALDKSKPAPKFINVPAKYFDPDSSGLRTTISKGTNTYNIEIPKK